MLCLLRWVLLPSRDKVDGVGDTVQYLQGDVF